jgi:hypothetical protein
MIVVEVVMTPAGLVGVSCEHSDLGSAEVGVEGDPGTGPVTETWGSGERAVLIVCCRRVKKETAIFEFDVHINVSIEAFVVGMSL